MPSGEFVGVANSGSAKSSSTSNSGAAVMLGSGTGSELRQPLGYAMVGGLLLSQALTLYTTPVVYLYLDRLRVWLASRRRQDNAMAPHLAAEGAPAGE